MKCPEIYPHSYKGINCVACHNLRKRFFSFWFFELLTAIGLITGLLILFTMPAWSQEVYNYQPPLKFVTRLGPARLVEENQFMDVKEFAQKNNLPQPEWRSWLPWHLKVGKRLQVLIAECAKDAGYPTGDVMMRVSFSSSGHVHVDLLRPCFVDGASLVMQNAYKALEAYPDDIRFPDWSRRLSTAYVLATHLPSTGFVEMRPITTDYELIKPVIK